LVGKDGQAGEVVVRASKLIEEPNNEFWWGCKNTFGIDPRNVHELEHVNNILSEISSIPVLKVIKKVKTTREFVVVEKLEGQVVQSFISQPSSVLQSLGNGLAKIHQYKESYVGNPSGNFRVPLNDFHNHLIEGTTKLVSKFYSNHKKIVNMLPVINKTLKNLPSPDYSSFVLVDMDPTQFLSNKKIITGLVDTKGICHSTKKARFYWIRIYFR
jgi:hypothetical protein